MLLENNVPIYGIVTDGKREYPRYIRRLNRQLKEEGIIAKNNQIKHTFCVFHFKKNLYENANISWFGKRQVKKQLPEHLLNQIQQFDRVLDASSREEALHQLKELCNEKLLFVTELREQLGHLEKYKEEYTLHIDFPMLKTSDAAENYFSITRPEKIKKAYKTDWGLNIIAQLQTVQKFYKKSWLKKLNLKYGFPEALQLLLDCQKLKLAAN